MSKPVGCWFARGSALAALLAPLAAAAQQGPLELSISSTATGTSNGASSASGLEQRDLFLSVRPSLAFAKAGPGLRLRADLGMDLITARNETRKDQALPFVQAKAETTVVDRFVFVDAALEVRQIEQDAFASRVEQGSTQNARTASTATLSPYISRELTSDLSLLARAEVAWLRYSGDSSQDSQTGNMSAKLTAKPRPIGGLVELKTFKSEYATSSTNDWRVDAVTAGPTYSPNNELVLGLVGGTERTTSSGTTQTDSVVGVTAYWVPSQRTNLAVSVDKRFFGTGWNASFTHRMPSVSFALRAAREPMLPTVAGVGTRGNLSAFLDAILTTRFPDPVQRAALVSEMIATRGLQTSVQGTAGSVSNYAQLASGGETTVVFLGTRNTVSVSIYQQTITLLTRADGTSQFLGSGDSDNRQQGATVGVNRRLSPNTALDFSARWSRIEGLSSRVGDVTRESSVRLGVVRNTAPRTSVSLGVQHRQTDTNVSNLTSFEETSAFAGVAHRF